jgi:hypothetical protein
MKLLKYLSICAALAFSSMAYAAFDTSVPFIVVQSVRGTYYFLQEGVYYATTSPNASVTAEAVGGIRPNFSASGGGSGSGTVADGANVALGSTTDAATTPGGAGTMSGKTRLITSQLDDAVNAITATNTQLPPATGTQTIANSMSVTPATSSVFTTNEVDSSALSGVGTCTSSCNSTTLLSGTTDGYSSITFQLTAAGTGTLTFQCSDDNFVATAITCDGVLLTAISSGNSTVTTAAAVGMWRFPVQSRYFRIQFTAYTSGTFTGVGYLRKTPFSTVTPSVHLGSTPTIAGGQQAESAARNGNALSVGCKARLTTHASAIADLDAVDCTGTADGALVTKPFSMESFDWNYAAASGGIANTTTAVTIKAAGASGIKNYLTAIDLMCEALTNATEVAIRDGAGGTVLWRTKVGTGGLLGGRHIYFPNPLVGTAATLMEVLTITASGAGACYFNASGYVAP